MFNIRVQYPSEAEELEIVRQTTSVRTVEPARVLTGEDCLRIQELVRSIPVADHVIRYALRIVRATRVRDDGERPKIVRDYLSWGAGPRASQFLVLAAKAKAMLSGSTHVMPEHVQAVALPVMRHRIIVNFNAEADGVTTDAVVRALLDQIPVDRTDPATERDLNSVLR
jgi:MoxR-like ATPase